MPVRDAAAEGQDRRRGRGRRGILVGCGGLAAVLFVLILAYLGWANYLPAPEPETAAMPNPNGYRACLTALASMSPLPANSPVNKPETASAGALRAALQPNTAGLEQLRKAIRLEYRNPPIRDPATLLPELAQYRNAARLFSAQSHLEAAEGHWDRAMESALDPIEMASRFPRGGLLVHFLVGRACTALGVPQAERCVPHLSPTETRRARERVGRIIRQYPTLPEVMEEERRSGLAALRLLFKGKYAASTLTAMGSGTAPAANPLLDTLVYVYPKSWSYGSLDRFYRAVIAEAKKPYGQQQNPPLPSDPITASMAPVTNSSRRSAAYNETQLQLLHLSLALREYRQRHGRYPASLKALAPAIFEGLPTDPFSQKPFVYRPKGKGYLLYSVGPDRTDNGGKPVPPKSRFNGGAGDLVARPDSAAG
jgi:hypothetical protein